jgi:WD40 repeat protein
VEVWSWSDKELLGELSAPVNSDVRTIAFFDAGRYVAATDNLGGLFVWDIAETTIVDGEYSQGGSSDARDVVELPHTNRLLCVFKNRIDLGHMQDGGFVCDRLSMAYGAEDVIVRHAVSANEEKLCVGTADGRVQVVNLRVPYERYVVPLMCPRDTVAAIALSMDGRYVAVACENKGSQRSDTGVTIWDTNKRERLLRLPASSKPVRKLAFHGSESRLLIVRSESQEVEVWNVALLIERLKPFGLPGADYPENN